MREQLVWAAEQTIGAAAEALAWSTGDPQGVLAHVAAADPLLMADTRLVYERLAAGRTSVEKIRDLREVYRTSDSLFEIAALPWTVASEWTSRVVAAVRVSPVDQSDRRARAAQSVTSDALLACRLWGDEELNIERIGLWRRWVSSSTDWCWRFENAKQ